MSSWRAWSQCGEHMRRPRGAGAARHGGKPGAWACVRSVSGVGGHALGLRNRAGAGLWHTTRDMSGPAPRSLGAWNRSTAFIKEPSTGFSSLKFTVLSPCSATGVLFTVWSKLRAVPRADARLWLSYAASTTTRTTRARSTTSRRCRRRLSATVGLGNIGGCRGRGRAAGGPGAVLWMWLIGFWWAWPSR